MSAAHHSEDCAPEAAAGPPEDCAPEAAAGTPVFSRANVFEFIFIQILINNHLQNIRQPKQKLHMVTSCVETRDVPDSVHMFWALRRPHVIPTCCHRCVPNICPPHTSFLIQSAKMTHITYSVFPQLISLYELGLQCRNFEQISGAHRNPRQI